MNYNLFHNTSCLGDAYLSRLHLNDLNIPKDTTKAKFIKYFNDKTVVLTIRLSLACCSLGHIVVNTVRLAASQFSKINRPIFF